MSKKEKIVDAKNLKKIYNQGHPNEVQALKGIDLTVDKGETMTIMGPSGSGKTTLLNCISGIDEATSGEIFVAGKDLQKMKDGEKTRYRAKNMGFIFQTFNLIPVLTAVENVEMPLLVTGVKAKEARERSLEMLKIVGLEDRAEHKPSELSGGQVQRVTIARSLVHRPAIVWADEPTGNLDSKTAHSVFDLMLELNDKYNETFVVVTHDEEIAKKTQRIVNIDSGKLV
ncbi:ABC transporter ATP-binding protein [Candidatus Dojkabacteria bacterium]|nr:ABC transporter ATP-binding protein [Candidatus Dojkabacteria bacterium]